MKNAIFLDRDGVINRKAPEGSYIVRWEDFHFLPGIVEAVAEINSADFQVIVITNQRCVAKGLISRTDLDILHQRMSDFLAKRGARIDAIYCCPHEVDVHCRCRKPAPGMLLDAANDHHLELAGSWIIGDSEIDIQAGRSAGCKTALLQDVNGTISKGSPIADYGADLIGNSAVDLVSRILNYRKQGAAVSGNWPRQAHSRSVESNTPSN